MNVEDDAIDNNREGLMVNKPKKGIVLEISCDDLKVPTKKFNDKKQS